MEEEEKKEQFKVTDKRRFTKDGELKGEPEAPEQNSKTDEDPEKEGKTEEQETPTPEENQEKQGEEGGQKAEQTAEQGPIEEVNFSNFVLSLSSVALLNLGEFPDPHTKKVEKNISMARYHIEILEVLKEKTKGNLSKNEDELLEHLLYQLRMKFVQASK